VCSTQRSHRAYDIKNRKAANYASGKPICTFLRMARGNDDRHPHGPDGSFDPYAQCRPSAIVLLAKLHYWTWHENICQLHIKQHQANPKQSHTLLKKRANTIHGQIIPIKQECAPQKPYRAIYQYSANHLNTDIKASRHELERMAAFIANSTLIHLQLLSLRYRNHAGHDNNRGRAIDRGNSHNIPPNQ